MLLVFVCTANVVRSPVAEKVAAASLAAAGIAAEVSSAGLAGGLLGSMLSPGSAAVLRAAGYPTDHTPRQLTVDDAEADLLVALDRTHQEMLLRLVGDESRVRLLRSFDPAAPPNAQVPDPSYGSGSAGYRRMLAMIAAAVPGLVEWASAVTPRRRSARTEYDGLCFRAQVTNVGFGNMYRQMALVGDFREELSR